MTSTVLPPATARAPIVQAMFPVPMMLTLLMRCAISFTAGGFSGTAALD
ncbi:hypothetical protein LDL08_35320 [Nonomuraea glycinis]|nr:hypothetical protein [Nonomuraea glycinis]MCA2181447.1 hypothetical protein [Nonomuraea glycinis]